MKTIDRYYHVIDMLTEAAAGNVDAAYQHYGLCAVIWDSTVPSELPDVQMDVLKLMTHWPKYGGDDVYPLPGGWEAFGNAADRARGGDCGAMWGKSKYGCLRRELAAWLASELEDIINEVGDNENY